MAEDDVESIGGISVSVGASHAQLVSDLTRADQLLETWAKQKFTVNIGATATTPAAGAQGRQAAAPTGSSVVFGPRATAAAQAAAAQPAFVRAVNEQLAKSGQSWNAVTGEIEDASAAVRKHKEVIVDVQQTAAQPAALNIPTEALQGELQTILTLLREIVATSAKLATMPAPKVASGGGGKRPKGRAPVAGGDDEEEGTQYSRIQYVDQIERQRRSSRESRGPSPIEVNRSEAALTKQRRDEEKATARQRAQDEAAAARVRGQNDRQARDAALQAESARMQADSEARGGDRGSTFAPPMTQARRAQIERERQEQDVRIAEQRARGALPPNTPRRPQTLQSIRAQAQEERLVRSALRAAERRDEEVFAQAAPDLAVRREREVEERVARARANITASGRTGRTASSGIGALFGGTQGKLIEANARLAASDKAVSEAEKAALPFRRAIAEYDIDIATSSDRVSAALTKKKAAFVADPKTVAALDRERKAIEGQRDALEGVNKLQSGANVARNLAAITIGGAAFGFALKAVDAVLELTSRAVQPAIDRFTGFATVSGRVTDALSDQTKKAYGNVQGVVAMAQAQAGLSAKAAAVISPLVEEQAAIEAGNKNLTEAVGLFQTYTKARQQGLAGITTNTGGFLGTGILGTASTLQTVGNLFQGLPSPAQRGPIATIPNLSAGLGDFNPFGVRDLFGIAPTTTQVPNALQGTNIDLFNNGLKFANEQLEKGGEKILRFTDAATDPDAVAAAVAAAQTARAPDDFINSLRDGKIAIEGLSSDAIEAARQILQLGDAANRGARTFDPQTLGTAALRNEEARQRESAATVAAIQSRQAFAMPGIIAGIFRQQQYSAEVQQPTQFAMGALANPNLTVGTGIAPGDQGKVAGALQEAKDLQDDLNAEYAKGQQIIQDTYRPAIVKNFGNTAAQAFDTALNAVKTTGAEIAKVQASISNEQAAYQAAQYAFQLQIAQRSLRDIAGLTGANFGVESSRLGILQRENLELSRQGQQLQFQMSQRQINFQVALAGFQAPGVTPEERQARVREAQIEAKYAQDQLNIQRRMFGNQVKIVDISNLRQGRDLMKQIGLLQMGRQVTLDTAAAEQKLTRLNQLQQRNVQKVGTYLSAVDNLATVAMGNISELEAATGTLMAGLAKKVLEQFGIYVDGLTNALSGGVAMNSSGGPDDPTRGGGSTGTTGGSTAGGGGVGGGTGTTGGGGASTVSPFAFGQVVKPNGSDHKLTAGEIAWELSHGIDLNGNGRLGFAAGAVLNANRKTGITIGEAGNETVAILRNPRPYLDANGGFGGGGVTNIVNFNGPIGVRSEDDIDAIARKVESVLGRRAAQKGLRGAY